jgi:hypothetical protein
MKSKEDPKNKPWRVVRFNTTHEVKDRADATGLSNEEIYIMGVESAERKKRK